MFSSLLKIFKYRFPNAQLCLLIGNRNKHLDVFWRDHTFADEFLIHPRLTPLYIFHWLKFLIALRKRKFDLTIIQAHKSVVNKIKGTWFPVDPAISYLCGITTILGYYDRWKQDYFFSSIINQFGLSEGKPLVRTPHWTDIAFEYALALGIQRVQFNAAIKRMVKYRSVALSIETSAKIKVAINPGGNKNFDRKWPKEKFKELCLKLFAEYNATIFLLGGLEEVEIRNDLKEAVQKENALVNIYSIQAKNLNETLNYIAKSEVFIGNDTGTTHLAAAIGETSVIAIFGPTDFDYWGPEGIDKRHKVVSLNLPCMPCDLLHEAVGHKECHLITDKHKCLKDLSTKRVFDAAKEAISAYTKSIRLS